MFKKLLQFKLRLLASLVLKKYKPLVVAITGSVGKTSTKEAIYCVLCAKFSSDGVRRNIKNYNNEIGVPLTILGLESAGNNFFGWLAIVANGLKMLLSKVDYPEVLILEMGADRPGDIKYLTSFIKPKIAVVTAIGEVPVHVEFFSSPAQVAREKAVLVQAAAKDGWAVLNYDDEAVRRMMEKTIDVITYGLTEGADVRAVNLEMNSLLAGGGINFKVDYQGKIFPLRLKGVLGRHQIYAILAAVCIGLKFNMNLVEIADALGDYHSPPGRMKLLSGIKHSWIIDDSYNAAPLSTAEALTALNDIVIGDGAKKIAVLGDMLELGQFTEREHRKIGKQAAKIVDLIFTVGARAKFIADQAREAGFPPQNIFSFDTSDEAKLAVQGHLREGDLILVKGSQGVRMEKVVEEIMAEPLRAKELLARQDEGWNK